MAAHMLSCGYARIINATNATARRDDDQSERNESPSATAPVPKTYHSTGIQTHPLSDAIQFVEIFGRRPGPAEIGIAAIGRYGFANGADTYQHEYGPPFAPPAALASNTESKYVDSSFQTIDYPEAKRRITKAKVKAIMTVNKYRKVAEEAGVRVFAEPNAERVIHSEQFMPSVTLDADGNTKDGDLGSLFLPNIYGEEVLIQPPQTPTSLPSPATQQDSSKIAQTVRAIPSLAPSLREDVQDPDSIEDYGEEYIEKQWADEYQTRFLSEGGRGDGVPPPAFVVFDPAWCPSPITRSIGQTSDTVKLVKRKRSTKDYDRPSDTPSKRRKRSPSPKRLEEDTSDSDCEFHRGQRIARYHQGRVRGRATSYSSSGSEDRRKPLIANSKIEAADVSRAPKDHECNATASARTPRGRSASPRREERDRRYRSRSPADRHNKSRRYRNDSSDSEESYRKHRRHSRDRKRRDSRVDDTPRKNRTPAPEQVRHISKAPVEKTCATPSAHKSLKEDRASHEHLRKSEVTPPPAPPTSRQSKILEKKSKVTPSNRERTPPSRPQSQHHNDQLTPTTRHTPRAPTEHNKTRQEATSSKRNTSGRNTTNILQATMLEARRAEDRRRELAHKPVAPTPPSRPKSDRIVTGRVEKTQRTPSRGVAEKTAPAKKAEEKKTPAPERKPPTGPRPRRDAKSLINRWLGA
ncbi:hypothetical protein NX059_011453 [Plenodomus lindquistii]|nr:hypothetical protein NX059_011453 [Plenodomus lindquistii]